MTDVNVKAQLAHKHSISQEQIDLILKYLSESSRNIILKEWTRNDNFPRANAREIRRATNEFMDMRGILFLRNYSRFSNNYVKALSMLTEHFLGEASTFYQSDASAMYDAESIVLYCKKVLTETEWQITKCRYGFLDGKKKTMKEIQQIFAMQYSVEAIKSTLRRAEKKISKFYF